MNGFSSFSKCMMVAAAAVVTASVAGGQAHASSVYGLDATLTGSRTVGNGLEISGSHPQLDWSNVEIAWNITENAGTFFYQYTITNLNTPALSHLVLDITPNALRGDALADPNAFVNPTINGQAWNNIEFNEGSFPQEDGITGGVKFDNLNFGDFTTLVFEFESNRAPVWGNIVLKGGNVSLFNSAYNSLNEAILASVQNFIARPNGEHMVVVPLPAAAWGGLALLGMLGVGQGLRRRRLAREA